MAAHPVRPPGHGAGPGGQAPDPRLVSASAMVFVDDLSAPVLDVADLRHLIDVLRLRAGQPVAVSDGSGSWAPHRVSAAVSGHRARDLDPGEVLLPDGPTTLEPQARPLLTVAFVPAKGDRPEWVVQKLTEVGVDRIVPLRAARSVVRWDGDRAERAVDRLRRVAREASAQCRRVRLPEVTPVSSLSALMSTVDGAGSPPCLAQPGGAPPSLEHPVIAIGPEGGWEPEELASSHRAVGLGPTVLRAETAAVVAGTLLCALRAGVVANLA